MRIVFILIVSFFTLIANPYKNIINYKLDNGLNVYMLPDKKAKNFYIEVAVNVGMRAESKEKAGISHLLEHLIFRDKNIKFNDYYDYLNDNGVYDINGYTSDYKTTYYAKVDANKSYWLVKNFYKMIFEKNITNEDLEIEKKALQLEIGEPNWIDYLSFIPFEKIGDFIDNLSPKGLDYQLYRDDFKIDTKKGIFKRYDNLVYKRNNKKFTLNEVLEHYKNYYYPANMTLKVVGNFDANKMKELISSTFAKVKKRDGKSLKIVIYKDAKLSNEPFIQNDMPGGPPEAKVAMGYKFIDNNLTKKIVLNSYFDYLANRLNRVLRNKKGESYSVYGYTTTVHDAGLGKISFTTNHDNFEKNIALAKDILTKEAKGKIDDEVIKKSIENRKKYYESTSHDVESLMGVVDNIIYLKRFYQDSYRNPYEIIGSLRVEEYRDILLKNLDDKNFYFVKTKDYFLFPFEGLIVILFTFIAFIYILKKRGSKILHKKDIRLKRRIGNIFVSFITILIVMIGAGIISDWIVYLVITLIDPELLKISYFGTPVDYILIILNFILYVTIFFILGYLLFKWFYAKLYLTNDKLFLIGYKYKIINLNSIKSVEIVPWSIKKFKDIYGLGLLFFNKLIKITTNDGKEFYIRYKKPQQLKEEILEFVNRVKS